ncbi:MAG TPA: hypothetical protein VFA41_21370 [Ktedonobacteraceae bacterium]|jgi:hypothetical protein|nr:hypothetical protein [Ktedonobacteraceae bacterium]
MITTLTRETLCSLLAQVRATPLPPFSCNIFQKHDLSSEETIRFQRGATSSFQNAAHFWISVLLDEASTMAPPQAERFLETVVSERYTTCQPISLEEFLHIVKHYDFVEDIHDFAPHGPFQQGWLIYDVGTEIAVLAETTTEFVAFSWELVD